jgi:hypothetical protein
MSSALDKRCQMLKSEIEQIVSIVTLNSAPIHFSVDDRYEVEYLLNCLENNARRLKLVLKGNVQQLQTNATRDDKSFTDSTVALLGETSCRIDSSDLMLVTNNLEKEQKSSLMDATVCKVLETSDSDDATASDITEFHSPSAIHDVCNNITVTHCVVQCVLFQRLALKCVV